VRTIGVDKNLSRTGRHMASTYRELPHEEVMVEALEAERFFNTSGYQNGVELLPLMRDSSSSWPGKETGIRRQSRLSNINWAASASAILFHFTGGLMHESYAACAARSI
jgi:hypothetical protein